MFRPAAAAARIARKVRLHGFNNLTKSLSFNLYDVCYARSEPDIRAYLDYLSSEYSAARLTGILRRLAELIGANVLHVSQADFEPAGASVTMLVSEEAQVPEGVNNSQSPGPAGRSVAVHLDKSHLTVHTYPESHPGLGISTFRADLDVSTCGMISPLKALNFLLHSFDSDIVYLDYRVRGFTRDREGGKIYLDHAIDSIRNYLDEDTRRAYESFDHNLPEDNIFHSRLCVRDFLLDDYLFNVRAADLQPAERADIEARLRREMREIFHARDGPGSR